MVTKGFVTLILFLCTVLTSHAALAATNEGSIEYAFTPVLDDEQDYQTYLDTLDIPKIRAVRQYSDDGEHYWTDILDQNDKKLKRFSDNYNVTTLGQGRYIDSAMLLVTASLKDCKNNCTHHYLFGSNIHPPQLSRSLMGSVFSTLVLKNTHFVSMNEDGLLIQDMSNGSAHTIKAPIKIIDGTIGSNIESDWQAIAIGKGGEIMVANQHGWTILDLALPERGDKTGTVSIYPKTQNTALIAVYRFINEYNKGLYIINYDFKSEKVNQEGWLFNSENQNIGFDPEIYFYKARNEVIVSSTNSSTNNSDVYFRIPSSKIAELKYSLPDHIQNGDFNNEKTSSFMIGQSVSNVSWASQSEVKEGSTTFGEADYEIADSLFTSTNIEARFHNTSLTINYLQNRAKDIANSGTNHSTKKASRYLFAAIDFQNALSASSSLRLLLEQGKTNGFAKIDIVGSDREVVSFTSKYNRLALISMQERGAYIGVDYINYSMPSVVGFSDYNEDFVYTHYDSDLEFSSVRFLKGYDTLAYAKRYETDFSKWYTSGGVNAGLGWTELSDQTVSNVKQSTGKNDIAEIPLFFALGGELEIGYLWQKRSRAFKGLGYSVALGYKINGNYMSSLTFNDENEKNSLYLEFDKWDVLHGPFLKANVIF